MSRKCISTVLLVALVLLTGIHAVTTEAFFYTPIQGNSLTVEQQLFLEDKNTPVPAVTYTFRATEPEVLFEGRHADGAPTIVGVSFSPEDGNSVVTEGNGVYQRYIGKPVGLDFTEVTFYEPNFYRWKIIRTAAYEDGSTKEDEYYIFVQVQNSETVDTDLMIANYKLFTEVDPESGNGIGVELIDLRDEYAAPGESAEPEVVMCEESDTVSFMQTIAPAILLIIAIIVILAVIVMIRWRKSKADSET